MDEEDRRPVSGARFDDLQGQSVRRGPGILFTDHYAARRYDRLSLPGFPVRGVSGIAGGRFGGVVSYGLFENTSLALEYLHGEFENNDERDLLTAQFGLEF